MSVNSRLSSSIDGMLQSDSPEPLDAAASSRGAGLQLLHQMPLPREGAGETMVCGLESNFQPQRAKPLLATT